MESRRKERTHSVQERQGGETSREEGEGEGEVTCASRYTPFHTNLCNFKKKKIITACCFDRDALNYQKSLMKLTRERST